VPTIVIVDRLTASAGEIIALALQEKGVPVVGEQSFGKGTIQTWEEFLDGSSLKYTIGKWFSPLHTDVNGTGIIPDIEIERNAEVYQASGVDVQLEKAKERLIESMLAV
jgi:carboxyl-terminal processing protease